MAPVFNTTAVCNTTESCAHALDFMQELFDDTKRLSYILGSLLGIVSILFLLSPIICCNLPKRRDDDYDSSRARAYPHPNESEDIQMHDFANRNAPHRDEFIIDSEEDEQSDPTKKASSSILFDQSHFRAVNVDGETFHVARSDGTMPKQTSVFRGAGDEQQLAPGCFREGRRTSFVSSLTTLPEGQPTSVVSSLTTGPGSSYGAEGENGRNSTSHERIGAAVSV
jgi:hypothetical protein